MRRSKVLEKLRSGKVAYCTQVGSGFAPFAGIAAQLGFDCVWLDNEHKPGTYEDLRDCICACTIYDCDTCFRILKRSYADYFRPLEDGATGIMVPHCKSKADAEFAVYNTKFQPVGMRGIDTTGLGCDFMMAPAQEAMDHANRETFTMLQIEDIEALNCIDDIVATEGVDLLFVGPADLTQSAKRFGLWHDGFLLEAFEKVGKACSRRPGIWWGTSVGTKEMAQAAYDRGARFISMRGDFGAVRNGYAGALSDLEELFGK